MEKPSPMREEGERRLSVEGVPMEMGVPSCVQGLEAPSARWEDVDDDDTFADVDADAIVCSGERKSSCDRAAMIQVLAGRSFIFLVCSFPFLGLCSLQSTMCM